jgi:hypothetical protein
MGIADGANAARLRQQRVIETDRRDARLFADEARLRLEAVLHGKTPVDRDDLQATHDVISKAARLLHHAEDAEKWSIS